jgi:hypothetical protein
MIRKYAIKNKRGGECREGGTVPSHEEKGIGKLLLGLFCKINDLRNIGKILQTEADGVRMPLIHIERFPRFENRRDIAKTEIGYLTHTL